MRRLGIAALLAAALGCGGKDECSGGEYRCEGTTWLQQCQGGQWVNIYNCPVDGYYYDGTCGQTALGACCVSPGNAYCYRP